MSVAPADKGHSPFPSPERAFYGFAGYLSSYIFSIVYLMWAFLPDECLNAIGFTYFPQKYWALAVPAYGCMAFMVAMALYFGGNMFIVPDMTDIRNITDSHALPPPTSSHSHSSSLPPVYDIPIAQVNEMTFRHHHHI